MCRLGIIDSALVFNVVPFGRCNSNHTPPAAAAAMVDEVFYVECVKNCSNWNRKISSRIKTSRVVFDQQTGIMQRPTTTLYRSPLERCTPTNPHQVGVL